MRIDIADARRAFCGLFAAALISGQALAQAPPAAPAIVPANVLLAEHSNWFTPAKIYDLRREHYPLASYPAGLNYEIYSAVGFDLANTILIKGPSRAPSGERELIVIDTLGNPEVSQRTIKAFRAQGLLPQCPDFSFGQPVPAACKLPLRAIIYTHNHIDHTFGVWGFLDLADRPPCPVADPKTPGADTVLDTAVENRDCVAVIGQSKINDGVGTTALVTGTIIDARSSYMYGNFIPRNHVNSGIGPQELGARTEVDGKQVLVNGSYRMPSRTFSNELKVLAAGVQMQLVYVPSETNDELAVFLPDRRNGTTPPSDNDWSGPGLLQSAEVIQGPSFPNLYSLRGTAYRDPANWFRSVDRLRQFNAWCMVPSHGPPLCEASNIQRLLKNFRDAIQFTHDQTIRWMNKGYTMNELAPLVESLYLEAGQHDYLMGQLDGVRPIKNQNVAANRCPDSPARVVPPHQAVPPAQDCVNPRDYLRPFYGSVVQAVREIYVGSVGWYEADPVALRPTPPKRMAEETLKLTCVPKPQGNGAMICGADAANIAAADALAKARSLKQGGEEAESLAQFQRAAELATIVVRAYTQLLPSDAIAEVQALKTARALKAEAFLGLAEPQLNPNWRNFYITAAHELQDIPLPSDIKGGLVAPGVIGALPAAAWVNSLTLRLRAEVTAKNAVNQSFGFWFPAEGNQGFGAQGFLLHLRHGIAEFVQETAAGQPLPQRDVAAADFSVSMSKTALDALLLAEARGADEFRKAWDAAVQSGQITCLAGGNSCLEPFAKHFALYFDPKPTGLPPLADR